MAVRPKLVVQHFVFAVAKEVLPFRGRLAPIGLVRHEAKGRDAILARQHDVLGKLENLVLRLGLDAVSSRPGGESSYFFVDPGNGRVDEERQSL